MEDVYLTGVGIAFLISFVKVCMAASALLSVRSKNMARIGLYYSCLAGTYEPKQFKLSRFLIYLFYMLAVAPIFSWLSVASGLWSFISAHSNRTPVPDNIKAIQWKMANIQMSKEQLIELQEEMAKILGSGGPVRTGPTTEEEEENRLTLVLDSGEWYSEFEINPPQKLLTYYGHTPDYWSVFHSIYEYQFEKEALLVRLIEDRTEHPGEDDNWNVRDGVVLESAIRDRHEKRKFPIDSVEDRIARYKTDITWQPMTRHDVRFFAMTKHPELFPHRELKRIIRTELERINEVTRNVFRELADLGMEIVESEDGLDFRLPDGSPESAKEKAKQFFEPESLQKYGTNFAELQLSKKTQAELTRLLSEREAA